MRKGPSTHHVVPNPKGGWDVKRGGAKQASGHFGTKREAIDAIMIFGRLEPCPLSTKEKL